MLFIGITQLTILTSGFYSQTFLSSASGRIKTQDLWYQRGITNGIKVQPMLIIRKGNTKGKLATRTIPKYFFIEKLLHPSFL
jgi:hypothetical protein